MWIVTVLLLLAGGLLGAAGLIVKKRPDAQKLIDKLVPYQGIIGVIMLAWGLRDLIYLFRALSAIGHPTFWWFVFLITTVTELGLGFLLGYGLIVKYVIGKNETAIAKTELVRAKLRVYQGPLGLTAIVLAVVFFLSSMGH
ncbi:MAG: hypothetical protein HJJLKODD_00472 [Phycisphaerae bacterium]|nr:hypothetical protein [Phycisphaerae bacterium]